jgi:hypothetical protein
MLHASYPRHCGSACIQITHYTLESQTKATMDKAGIEHRPMHCSHAASDECTAAVACCVALRYKWTVSSHCCATAMKQAPREAWHAVMRKHITFCSSRCSPNSAQVQQLLPPAGTCRQQLNSMQLQSSAAAFNNCITTCLRVQPCLRVLCLTHPCIKAIAHIHGQHTRAAAG